MAHKILIVDDEKEIANMIRMTLEMQGYEVLLAYDGEEGLTAARNHKPDLMLLDVMMPKINGYQVCRELKTNAPTQKIPIIMLTAKAQESDRFWAKETGVDDYIVKPFEIVNLLDKIKKLLGA